MIGTNLRLLKATLINVAIHTAWRPLRISANPVMLLQQFSLGPQGLTAIGGCFQSFHRSGNNIHRADESSGLKLITPSNNKSQKPSTELTPCLANYSITKKIVLELSSCFYEMTETTVLDFKLSNTFEEFRTHMNAPEQQAMFAQMGVKTFYIGVSKDDPGRAIVMFQGPENVLFDIFMNPETKPVVEASGHIYDGTVVTRWLA